MPRASRPPAASGCVEPLRLRSKKMPTSGQEPKPAAANLISVPGGPEAGWAERAEVPGAGACEAVALGAGFVSGLGAAVAGGSGVVVAGRTAPWRGVLSRMGIGLPSGGWR
jgi:hypothetical protein